MHACGGGCLRFLGEIRAHSRDVDIYTPEISADAMEVVEQELRLRYRPDFRIDLQLAGVDPAGHPHDQEPDGLGARRRAMAAPSERHGRVPTDGKPRGDACISRQRTFGTDEVDVDELLATIAAAAEAAR